LIFLQQSSGEVGVLIVVSRVLAKNRHLSE
jgi:hypothetical protein